MQRPTFATLFSLLSATSLSAADLDQLRTWIAGIRAPADCLALVESAATGRPCPHCRCVRVHRCGFATGLQRFRCLGCRRTFNALTGTPLARLRKRERWLPFLQCMLASRTVREAALVTGVHRTTSFRWRHRFAPGAARHRPVRLSAIVEADETYRLESQPVLPRDVLLISDSAAAYASFAAAAGITHESINVRAGQRARGAIHIQNVNSWHSRFKGWLARFKGVASRYLAHYSGWQRLLDARELGTPAQWLRAAVRQV